MATSVIMTASVGGGNLLEIAIAPEVLNTLLGWDNPFLLGSTCAGVGQNSAAPIHPAAPLPSFGAEVIAHSYGTTISCATTLSYAPTFPIRMLM